MTADQPTQPVDPWANGGQGWAGQPGPQPTEPPPHYAPYPAGQAMAHGGMAPYAESAYYVPNAQIRSNVVLNYWLSVFFSWLPALIFYQSDKGKNPLADEHNKATLNFSILRGIVWLATFVPGVTGFAWLAAVVLFVISVVGAVSGTAAFDRGQTYRYPLAPTFVR